MTKVERSAVIDRPVGDVWEFEPVNGSTRLTASGELDAHRLFRLAEPVFARITGRELEANLGHLKDLLEAAAEGRS